MVVWCWQIYLVIFSFDDAHELRWIDVNLEFKFCFWYLHLFFVVVKRNSNSSHSRTILIISDPYFGF